MTDETLGGFLRNEREKRGITIEQVASATKVSVRILYSLEGGQWADLPAKPFVRGFVISYCRYIGTDHKEVLSRFKGELSEKSKEREGRHVAPSGYAFERKDTERSRTVLWVSLVGFLLIGGVSYYVIKPLLQKRKMSAVERFKGVDKKSEKSLKKALENNTEDQKKSTVDSSTLVTTSAPAKVVDPAQPTSAIKVVDSNRKSMEPGRVPTTEDPLNKGDTLKGAEIFEKLVIKSLANVWVRYQVDDRPPMRFILEKERLLVLRARETIHAQVSNEDAVRIRIGRSGYRDLRTSPLKLTRTGNPTLVLPADQASTLPDPFRGKPSLPATPAPVAESEPVSASESP